MTETVYYRLIGKEDLKIGRGTFEVSLADDRKVTLTEIFLPDYAEDSGTTDSYAVTISGLPNPYVSGQVIFFKANTANTGAATLNVNSAGAKTIKKYYDQDLADNDIKASQIVQVVYDGTNFQMLNHTGNFLIDRMATEVYAADAGASDAYAITLTPAPAAYTEGMLVNFKANTANTGAATLNVNSLGAKTIKKEGSVDLDTGDIVSGQIVSVIYDGTNFQMQSAQSNIAYEDRANTFTQLQTFSEGATISKDLTLAGAAWPSFSVELSGGQANIGTSSKVQWNSENFDTNNDFDSTTNYRFTPSVAGKYLFSAHVRIENFAAGDTIKLLIQKNVSGADHDWRYIVNVNELGDLSVTTIYDMNGSTDYVEVYVGDDTTSTADIAPNVSYNYFTGCRIA